MVTSPRSKTFYPPQTAAPAISSPRQEFRQAGPFAALNECIASAESIKARPLVNVPRLHTGSIVGGQRKNSTCATSARNRTFESECISPGRFRTEQSTCRYYSNGSGLNGERTSPFKMSIEGKSFHKSKPIDYPLSLKQFVNYQMSKPLDEGQRNFNSIDTY
jgi:hypothetical protein